MTSQPLVLARAESLTRSFDGDVAVGGLDLEVHSGEIHAVVGLNGAGKTTLMRLLLGMLKPDEGRVLVMDHDASAASSDVWAQVGHLIETPFAYPELTVAENLTAAALLHGVNPNQVPHLIERTVEEYELTRWSAKKTRTLSLGNRQRLGIASALVHGPSLMVLDEPANALDPAGVVFIRDLLKRLASRGSGILVSSHHLDELARIAGRITVLHAGRIVGSLDPGGVDLERRFFDLVYEADVALREGGR